MTLEQEILGMLGRERGGFELRSKDQPVRSSAAVCSEALLGSIMRGRAWCDEDKIWGQLLPLGS